jgi:hypothetical protein
MKRKILICLLVLGLGVGTATAQFGSGIVYDPTNYHNALLRYYQLQQHLIQLQKSYAKITGQLNLALQMAQFVKNMPARYRALFSQWRNVTSLNTFGNTVSWINGINTGVLPNINTGYLKATTPLSQYSPVRTVGNGRLRTRARAIPVRVRPTRGRRKHKRDGHHRFDPWHCRQCPDSDRKPRTRFLFGRLKSQHEVSVLNKINAAGVLTLRTVQDSNKLLASLLEQQTILAKQQRDATTNAINTDIGRQASMAATWRR